MSGKSLKEVLSERGVDTVAFARETGVASTLMVGYINGATPTDSNAVKIAAALGLGVDELWPEVATSVEEAMEEAAVTPGVADASDTASESAAVDPAETEHPEDDQPVMGLKRGDTVKLVSRRVRDRQGMEYDGMVMLRGENLTVYTGIMLDGLIDGPGKPMILSDPILSSEQQVHASSAVIDMSGELCIVLFRAGAATPGSPDRVEIHPGTMVGELVVV